MTDSVAIQILFGTSTGDVPLTELRVVKVATPRT